MITFAQSRRLSLDFSSCILFACNHPTEVFYNQDVMVRSYQQLEGGKKDLRRVGPLYHSQSVYLGEGHLHTPHSAIPTPLAFRVSHKMLGPIPSIP